MTAHHDPYRELELYLQKAQEEIVIAVKELEEHQETTTLDEKSDCCDTKTDNGIPPYAFRSHNNTNNSNAYYSNPKNIKLSRVNRVCYDGNLYDNEKNPNISCSPTRSKTSGSHFFSNSSSYIRGTNGTSTYSPNTRRRLWRMHPSISFPETSKDLLMLGRTPSSNSYLTCNNTITNGYSNHSGSHNDSSENHVSDISYQSYSSQCRQRSNSDTCPPRFHYGIPEEHCPYPRPPSGDVNLLSIWADNLVLELDKSLSGELNVSESVSSSSDYSLSPTKQDTTLELEHCEDTHYDIFSENKSQSLLLNTQSQLPHTFKNVSISPDSGIEHALYEPSEITEKFSASPIPVSKQNEYENCDIPQNTKDIPVDSITDCVDSAIIPRSTKHAQNNDYLPKCPEIFKDSVEPSLDLRKEKLSCLSNVFDKSDHKLESSLNPTSALNINNELFISESLTCDLQPIAPPHPFKDQSEILVSTIPNKHKSDKSQATQTEHTVSSHSSPVKKADSFAQAEDNQETGETIQNILIPEHKLLLETFTPDYGPIVETTHTVKVIPPTYNHEASITENATDEHNDFTPSFPKHAFYSLPKYKKALPNEFDKYNTLPKDCGKFVDITFPQRSVSQSAVSTISYSALDELAEFIRQMKNASYQQPSCADASTDVKEDKEKKDAVTQTSPAPISRSSSFTWVTDYECSDTDGPNANSPSEDESLALSSCSNCKAVNGKFPDSSSSSLAVTSEEDDCPASPHSDASSLYLSACSGSSDSFDEAVITMNGVALEPVTCSEHDYLLLANRRTLRSSEMTLRGSTLGDISEEQGTSETLSFKSNISNPSLLDSNGVEPLEESASFPSTLKLSRKCKPTGSPAQPIEPTILIINDLNLKSISAPVLLRQKKYTVNPKLLESSSSDSSPPSEARCKDIITPQDLARSHSAKELNELQAIEACSWLRAAGFPQYAQMYDDNQFPVDINVVQKDHSFLNPDSIQSLFRRVNTLNRCTKMKFKDHLRRAALHTEESDDEEEYALSENWEFQSTSRRWSRISSPPDGIPEFASNDPPPTLIIPAKKYLTPEEAYCSSHDSVFVDDQHSSSPDSVKRSVTLKSEKKLATSAVLFGDCSPGSSSGSGGTISLASEEMPQESRKLRRSGSDRVKDGARALLKRMESLKGKRKKKATDANKSEPAPVVNSGTDGSSSSDLTSSPKSRRSQKQVTKTPEHTVKRKTANKVDTASNTDNDYSLIVVSGRWRESHSNPTTPTRPFISSPTAVTVTSPQEEPAMNPTDESQICDNYRKKNFLHPDSYGREDSSNCDKRGSYYDNVCAPLVVFNDLFTDSLGETPSDTLKKTPTSHSSVENANKNQEDGDIIIVTNERRDSGVGSSLTRGITYQQAPWHCFPFLPLTETRNATSPTTVTELTACQILLIRKLSLLKLTTLMEKFSPSSRTGWTWGVSKIIGRMRSPDYRDKVVFGVPLLMILQRTGQTLPVSIQAAIQYLRNTAMDASGLFRKSGVRSRIQKLKSLNETSPENISYEEHQAYDVADMLKQYFRELPEALLTNKLSETFITIFQFVPEEFKLEAIHSALMLMPDENREVLQVLLQFLNEVCQNSGVNQMTATNLAVCFAPSLFNLSASRSASSSPRRRKTVGVPDVRELNENKAAYECLSCMITNYTTLFSVSEDMTSQGRLSSASYSQPATIDELSSFASPNGLTGWRGYIDSCVQMFLKETKDKYKGFKTVSQHDHVELSYKKMVDAHPLKLWKVSTEVEAPPVELLNRVLRERSLWDDSYSKGRLITRLSQQTDIVQCTSTSLRSHPPCDFVVLRSWRTDLPKGACILIETSVEHPDAEVKPECVRGLILASRYLIEPCGSGKSRITHISRVDTRGRSPEWYNRAYGHICTLLLVKLRNSFSRSRAEGPETKV